ncbi:hypothetical protein AVEN_178729-1, partial [Araneus ventricosus]
HSFLECWIFGSVVEELSPLRPVVKQSSEAVRFALTV